MGKSVFSKVALVAALAGAAGCDDTNQSGALTSCTKVSGSICTIAGTGIAGDGDDRLAALKTNLYLPQDVTISPDGRPFISDWNNHRIRVVEKDGTMSIVAGIGELGPASDDPSTGRLNHPTNVTFDAQGRLIIAAWHNSRIKVVDLAAPDLPISDVCGTGQRGFMGDGGPAAMAVLNLPVSVVYNAAGDLIIGDQANNRIRMVDHATNIITTIAGDGMGRFGGDGGPALQASFFFPAGQSAQPGGRVEIDAAGNLYVSDTTNARVRKIDTSGIVSTIAGNGTYGYGGDGGPATDAMLSTPNDVAISADGSVYIADTDNSCVRVVRTDRTIATAAGICGQPGFSGDGGPATAAKVNGITGVAFDAAGNLYIADTHNQRVRVVYR